MRERPDTRSRIVGVLDPKEIVSYTRIVEKGEKINNNSLWYRLKNGSYIWSGGSIKHESKPLTT